MSLPRVRKIEAFSALVSAKLESSGISEDQAHALGFYETKNAQTLDLSFDESPALVIPYFDASGRPMRPHPSWPDFYRIRYLKESVGFSDVGEKKPQRYSQPPNTGVCAYLPNCQDWKSIQENPREAILITEGELKAAKASLEGFPTIGLGGVYNFRQSSRGVFLLPELEAFTWPRRRVTIVYDSDYTEKADICAAINRLAEELQERGAIVSVADLPSIFDGDIKTGLDDFLVEKSDEALIKVLEDAEPLAMTAHLWQMNEELCYVANPGLIISTQDRTKMAASAFTGHSDWSTASVPERKVTPTGKVSHEKVPAAPVWLRWPLRNRVSRITYLPGAPTFVDGMYNQWEGWGVEPKKGDITPWKDLIKFLFEGAEPEFVEWFLDWCAYPLQYPGTKLFSAVVVHGVTTGTGKSLLGYTLGRIYGKNFTKLENKDLDSQFNSWAENRQFVLGDEISGSDKRKFSDQMKTIITQEEVSINVKMLPAYSVPDRINYYFSSNHADAFFLEDHDRRFAVHEVLQEEALPDEFYRVYDRWKDGDGPSHLFHHLLNRDVSKFNPKAKAFRTQARARMTMLGKSDTGIWCAELREDAAAKLKFGKMTYTRDLFTATELLKMYQAESSTGDKVTANGLSRALAAAGFKQAAGGNPILGLDGKQGRYFIIRNHAKWMRVKSTRELAKHLASPPIRGE